MPLARDGTLGKPVYNVALIPTSPREESDLPGQFYAEELDFDFVSWLVSHLKEMKTRELWRPALVDLYTLVDGKDRQQALGFLLTVIKSFQTAEQQAVQMVDLSMAIPSIPLCLAKYPMILSRVLRGAEIVMTDPSPNDSDDESEEPQIVFQPSNSQEYLRLLEFLFHVFAKGVITDQQGEATAALSAKDVAALQELVKLEEEVNRLKNQVQSLNSQLNESETVQRDFVKLSQTLQMQLAEMQESENEVRWEHKDDARECRNCQKPLNTNKDK
ncbi:predicted protein, partial [Nematostella vectensis]